MSREVRLLTALSAKRCATSVNSLAIPRGVVFFVCAFLLSATALLGATSSASAATYRTTNFIIHADSETFATAAGQTAEILRRELAISWLGGELPPWSAPCVVTVTTSPTLQADGEATYTFEDGEVHNWKITAQGSEERVLDSVLPHEIMHTVLASYLRAKAPRWIDEGIATSTEADPERNGYRDRLVGYLRSNKGIPFNNMVAFTEYPDDVQPFYSQAFSVCEYLILIGGRRRLVEFAKEGTFTKDWNAALQRYYGCKSLGDLQVDWNAWVYEWVESKRPTRLPTAKLRGFDELRQAELAAIQRKAENEKRKELAQASSEDQSRKERKKTWGKLFPGVRSWGGNKENSEDAALNGRKERVEPTSAESSENVRTTTLDARGDRSRQFGETRQVAPNRRNAQTTLNGRERNVGGNAATILIPRANESTASNAAQASETGVLKSGAGSASRSVIFR